jgi:hypothetical protein
VKVWPLREFCARNCALQCMSIVRSSCGASENDERKLDLRTHNL